MQRKTWWLICAVLALPLMVLAALYFLVSPEKLQPVVEAQLSQALARRVTLGQLRLQFLPLSLSAENLVVAEAPGFGDAVLARAQSLEVSPRLLPLIRGQVEIASVKINAPVVELRQAASGQWNYESLGQRGGEATPPLVLDRLEILNATLGLNPHAGPRQQYERLSARLDGYAEGKPFRASLNAQTASGAEIGLDGEWQKDQQRIALRQVELHFAGLKGSLQGEINAERLSLNLAIPSSPIAEAAPLFLPKGTEVSGQVSAKLRAEGTFRAPLLNGDFTLIAFRAQGGEIKSPVETPKLNVAFTPTQITLAPFTINSGATRLEAQATVTDYATAPQIAATVRAPNAQLAELLAMAKVYGVQGLAGTDATGQARLDIAIRGPLSAKAPLNFSGSGALTSARFTSPELTKPVVLDRANFRFAENSLAIDEFSGQLATTKATGNLRVQNFRAPQVTFDLRADQVSLKEFETLFPKQSQSAPPPKLTADGQMTIAKLDLDNVLLENVRTRVSFRNGEAVLSPLTANLYGGQQTGELRMDMRQHPPQVTLRSKLDRVESSRLLAAATPVKGFLSGPLFSNVDLRFSAGEPADLVKSLNGKVALNMNGGQIAGLNLTNELAAVAKFLGYRASGASLTEILSLTGDLDFNNGQATTNNLELKIPNLSAAISGAIDLNNQTFNLKLVNTLDAKFSQQVGGNSIGSFLSAALASPQGNLIIPVTLEGTFQKPRMAPDAGAMAKLKLQNLDPSKPQNVIKQVDNILGIFKKKK
ncbi:MAG: AsmA family protein [Bryobacter sp.]|nr:AsmA family protein [Bryobacter sp.]